MIKALRKRTRPDNLVNQVRAGGKSLARRAYLAALGSVAVILVSAILGPLIFLDADGLVMKERSVISTDYNARVIQVHVRPGDEVKAGALLLSVTSSETTDRIADLTAKVAAASAREMQLRSRLTQITTLKPVASDRRQRAVTALRHLQSLQARQLTTAPRVGEATREAYEAEREEAQLVGELEVIRQEIAAAGTARKDLSDALDLLKKAYNSGQITAAADGTIGPKVPSSGSIIKVGETALDVYHGSTYVVGYLQTSRLFSVEAGDSVVVTDGKMRSGGTVVRIEAVADALPAEFQSVFSARERQQVVRIEMDSRRENDFPIHGKVKVTGLFTPTNLTSMLKTVIAFVTNSALRIAGIEPEAEPETRIARPHFADPMTVGSIRRSNAPRDDDEEQPFPEAQAPIDGRGVSAPVSLDAVSHVRAAQVRAQVTGPVLAGAKPALQTGRFSGWY
jgi:multidrug resistance efflux pump